MGKGIQNKVSGPSSGVSDGETMGRNEYARHQGVTPRAVTKAIESGRITKAVVYEGGHFKAIRWRLADQLWLANTDPAQALRRPAAYSPAAAVVAPPRPAAVPPSHDDLGRLLGDVVAATLVPWCALVSARHAISADTAIELMADGLMVLMTVADQYLCAGAGEFRVTFAGDAAAMIRPECRADLVERVKASADAYSRNADQGPPA